MPANGLNYSQGRVRAVDTIILHTTESTARSASLWFADPKARVSAHEIVTKDGGFIPCVDAHDTAWHAGNFSVNARSIGIEVEGWCGKPEMWTPSLLAALADRCAELCKTWSIKAVRGIPGIAGHCDIPDPRNPKLLGGTGHHTDPGPHFPWPMFIEMVRTRLEKPID